MPLHRGVRSPAKATTLYLGDSPPPSHPSHSELTSSGPSPKTISRTSLCQSINCTVWNGKQCRVGSSNLSRTISLRASAGSSSCPNPGPLMWKTSANLGKSGVLFGKSLRLAFLSHPSPRRRRWVASYTPRSSNTPSTPFQTSTFNTRCSHITTLVVVINFSIDHMVHSPLTSEHELHLLAFFVCFTLLAPCTPTKRQSAPEASSTCCNLHEPRTLCGQGALIVGPVHTMSISHARKKR
ncbi:hypothetical protein FPQ18DRAFT_166326 [Pyronema domesticum]|nr:hypothetical protein FPQ18DRAFT_166326 [Pyronema domesticum]